MDQGQLVPDSVVIGLVKEKLQEPSTAKGFLLDGFPRTTAQAEELDKTLKQKGQQLDRVVNVNVSRDEVVSSTHRKAKLSEVPSGISYRVCPSGSRRSLRSMRRLAGSAKRRSKGNGQARLAVYDEQTAPLIAYYRQRGLLSDLDGTGPIDQVQQRLVNLLAAQKLT